MVIPNQTLYRYLKESKGVSYEEYISLMKNIHKIRGSLKYSDLKGNQGWVTIQKNLYIDGLAQKGKKEFIDHFFQNGRYRLKFNEHFEAVAAKLFDFGVLVSFGHNGSIEIYYEADCFN